MDPLSNPLAAFITQGLTVVSLVVAVRKLVPKIDGGWVILLAGVISPLLVYAMFAVRTSGAPLLWPRFIGESLLIWGAAIGATTLADRSGKNAADQSVAVMTQPVSPPTALVSAEDGAKVDSKTVVKVVGE